MRGDEQLVVAWVLDFWRAFQERPKEAQEAACEAMGPYAWRELRGAHEALKESGYDPDASYGLEGMDYHKEARP